MPLFAAAVGGRTSRIRVRVSVLLAPLYDPVRLAEEVAVADLCLGGRLDLGMGVGYVEDDFEAFGADYHRRGAHLEWLVPFLRRAWTGEPFEHRGTTVTVTPRPVKDPMPIFLGGGTRAAIDRAVRLAEALRPQVVLMDVSLPVLDGVEATRQISRLVPESQVVMLTMHADADVMADAIHAGAVGYLVKDCSTEEVAAAVRMAASGEGIPVSSSGASSGPTGSRARCACQSASRRWRRSSTLRAPISARRVSSASWRRTPT